MFEKTLLISTLAMGIMIGIDPGQAACAYKSTDIATDVAAEKSPEYSISGRVVNQEHEPVSDVTVLLWESEGDLSMEAKTNEDGAFRFAHKACGKLSLQAQADPKLKLASAIVENLPGELTRKLIIELKVGFVVSGRIVHNNKGLKDLIVRVKPVGAKDNKTKIHGGGVAETDKKGEFSLVLLSGPKKLTVINDKYPNLEKHLEKTFTVDDDTELSKIELP